MAFTACEQHCLNTSSMQDLCYRSSTEITTVPKEKLVRHHLLSLHSYPLKITYCSSTLLSGTDVAKSFQKLSLDMFLELMAD